MSNYVLISSANRQESADATRCLEFAADLAVRGHKVTVFLVQNGVLAARGEQRELSEAARVGVNLLADDFSMRERGIAAADLHSRVSVSPLDFVIDRLAAGDKVVWH